LNSSFLTIDSRVILTTWFSVGDVERTVLLKKSIDDHRVSVGDVVVSDNDVASNHVAKINGLTGIGKEPVYSLYSTHLRHGLA
jgi:hypothetical protein